MTNEQMEFPKTWEEYEKEYGFNDSKEVYTNNSRLIPSFRVKQWLNHLPSIQPTTKENLVVEDCISRQAVLDCLTASGLKKFDFILDARDKIKKLPPVTPNSKTGHWIAQDIHNCHTDFRCSECGYIHSFMHLYGKPTADYTYCPKCGAKMLPTDSDKEWLPQYEGKWVTEKE